MGSSRTGTGFLDKSSNFEIGLGACCVFQKSALGSTSLGGAHGIGGSAGRGDILVVPTVSVEYTEDVCFNGGGGAVLSGTAGGPGLRDTFLDPGFDFLDFKDLVEA